MEACCFVEKTQRFCLHVLFFLNPFYQLLTVIQKAKKITPFTSRWYFQRLFFVGGDEKPTVVVVVKHLAVCLQGILWPFGSRWCYWEIRYVRIQRTSASVFPTDRGVAAGADFLFGVIGNGWLRCVGFLKAELENPMCFFLRCFFFKRQNCKNPMN